MGRWWEARDLHTSFPDPGTTCYTQDLSLALLAPPFPPPSQGWDRRGMSGKEQNFAKVSISRCQAVPPSTSALAKPHSCNCTNPSTARCQVAVSTKGTGHTKDAFHHCVGKMLIDDFLILESLTLHGEKPCWYFMTLEGLPS